MRIGSDADYAILSAAKARDKARDAVLMEVFRIKTHCWKCGYESMDIRPEQNTTCPMVGCYGNMEEH